MAFLWLLLFLPAALLGLIAWVEFERWRSRRQVRRQEPEWGHPVVLEPAVTAPIWQAVQALRASIPRPPVDLPVDLHAHLHRWHGRFDPQRWLAAFPKLSEPAGRVLDFVYQRHGTGGAPFLYWRAADAPRLDDQAALAAAGWCRPDDWLAHLTVTPDPEGWLQLLVLGRVARRFHLHWHSLADDLDYLLDPLQLQGIRQRLEPSPPRADGGPSAPFAISKEHWQRLATIDARPVVRLAGHSDAELTVWAFSEFSGLRRQRFQLCAAPVRIECLDDETVVPWHCGLHY